MNRRDLTGASLSFWYQACRNLPQVRRQLLGPTWSFWTDLSDGIAQMPRVFAEEAADALYQGDVATLNHYIRDLLEIRLDDDAYDAHDGFYRIIRQQGWRNAESGAIGHYIKTALLLEIKRNDRDREMPDRMRHQEYETPMVFAEPTFEDPAWSYPTSPNPLRTVILRQELERFAIQLPTDQRNLLVALLGGESPAEAIKRLRSTWPKYQSLQRKMQKGLPDLL